MTDTPFEPPAKPARKRTAAKPVTKPTAKAPRKPRAAGRAPSESAVRERAYALWEAAGRPPDEDQAFWFQAERDLRGGGDGA